MPRHAPADYRCPFCGYARGEGDDFVGPDHVVERTSVLVIPTSHHENLYELPDELGTSLQRAVRRAALALKAAYECDGVSTRQHNEPAGWANRAEMTIKAQALRAAYASLDRERDQKSTYGRSTVADESSGHANPP